MKTLFFPCGLLLLAGCSAFAPDPSSRIVRGDEGRSITVAEAEQRTKNFADRYVQLVADAADDIKERSREIPARREAHLLKLQSATSAWDVVTSSHPLQEMLDLFVQVELQTLIWDQEGLAAKKFGPDGGERLLRSLRSAKDEILVLVRRALIDQRIKELQALVLDWRKRNPSVEAGAFIRFGPYLDAPGGTLISQIISGFGILEGLNPLNSASDQVARVGDTADDAFYMAKRLPMLLEWQAEAATFEMLLAVDAAGANSKGMLQSGESLLRAATETARAAQGAVEAVAKLKGPEGDEKEPAGRPFDIREYESAAREARVLLVEAQDLAASPALTARAQRLGAYARKLVLLIFALAVLLLFVFFALLTVYRLVVSPRLRDPRSPT